jgi:hypothetical protein
LLDQRPVLKENWKKVPVLHTSIPGESLFSLKLSRSSRLAGKPIFDRAKDTPPDKPILDHALQRLRNHGIAINSLIDIGASNGIWSNSFAVHFPGRHHLLLEANQVYAKKIRCGRKQTPRTRANRDNGEPISVSSVSSCSTVFQTNPGFS